MFNPTKRFEFKKPGENVASVIKQVGLFNEEEEDVQEEKVEKPFAGQRTAQLFQDSDEEEEPLVVTQPAPTKVSKPLFSDSEDEE